MSNPILRCFVIMPFSNIERHERRDEYWDQFYKKFLLQVFKEPFAVAYTSQRYKIEIAKHNIMNGGLLEEVVKDLNEFDLSLVILTDMKPNVIYELGIRHSLKQGTILAIKKSNRPNVISSFTDINGEMVIDYEDFDSAGMRRKIAAIFKEKGLPSLWEDSKVKQILKRNKNVEPTEKEAYQELKRTDVLNPYDDLNLNILWMDNRSDTVAPIITFLIEKNCEVTLAVSTLHWKQYVDKIKYDVIISDMREGSDQFEGIDLFIHVAKDGNVNAKTQFIIFAGENAMNRGKKVALEQGVHEENLIVKPVPLLDRLQEIAKLLKK